VQDVGEIIGQSGQVAVCQVDGPGGDSQGVDPCALLAIPDDSPDDILRYLDKIAPLAKVGVAA